MKKKRRTEKQTHARVFESDKAFIKRVRKFKGFKSEAITIKWLIRRRKR